MSANRTVTVMQKRQPKQHRHTIMAVLLEFLSKNRGTHTWQAIMQLIPKFMGPMTQELLEEIRASPKIDYKEADQTLCYSPTYGIRNQKELYALLRSHPRGISAADLEDAYSGVAYDLEDLVAQKLVIEIFNPDTGAMVFFPRDTTEELQIRVDDDVRKLWSDIKMPSVTELESQLYASGHLSKAELKDHAVVGVVTSKKKRKRGFASKTKRRQTNLTNTHMIGEHSWLQKS